jgi:single-strand DNA-binding protein
MLVSEIIGNIGADAEIKEFSGKKYVSFCVAHSDFSKDQNGNKIEQTTWVSILWYGDGGGLFQYLKKGAKVFVRGRQKVKLYADKNGMAQFAINVNANEVILCGVRGESDNTDKSGGIPMQQNPQSPINNDMPDDFPF